MTLEWASVLRAVLFLGIPFVLGVFYLQWRWANTCSKNVRVLVALKGGGGQWALAPKEGGEVTITNKTTGEARTWAVNELSTIEVLYPGVGFVPAFMQKTIRMAIVNEGDWEPVLNRSPHRKMIASPDVVEYIRSLGGNNEKMKANIDNFLSKISTGPTREMVASPEMLGSLMQNGVLRALAQMSNEFMETLKGVNEKLSRLAGSSPMLIMYIMTGIVIVGIIYAIINQIKLGGEIDLIKNALGIVEPLPTPVVP
jgi:hypothetical protein